MKVPWDPAGIKDQIGRHRHRRGDAELGLDHVIFECAGYGLGAFGAAGEGDGGTVDGKGAGFGVFPVLTRDLSGIGVSPSLSSTRLTSAVMDIPMLMVFRPA